METADFFFELPEKLIAQQAPQERGNSRLLCLERSNGLKHGFLSDLPAWLDEGTLLVFNDTKVRKARLIGQTSSGGMVEALLLDPLPDQRWRVMMKRLKRRRIGTVITFPAELEAVIEEEDNEFRILKFNKIVDDRYLDVYGHVPLPPYIKRPDVSADAERYQTIYARETGSAAAPTAGLHFTKCLMDELMRQGFGVCYITLHVGLGTFLPVRSKTVEDHTMHEERYSVSQECAMAVNTAKSQGKPILAVGTTSLRTLESAWRGELKAGSGSTRLFIYPGYRFKVVDQLFTNFHVPESTLLILVSAFAGRDKVLAAYREAIAREYRFFSYGDAMLIK